MADFAHTGPETLAGKFMRQFWQPAHRSADIAPGRAKPIRILGEVFTLFRDEAGTVHLVDNRCAHRSAQLASGWVEGNAIRCLYHGWMFDGHSGQCIEAPGERTRFADSIRIRAYPAREHLGLVFVYLGEGDSPAFPYLPEFEGEGIIETWAEPFPCNFFQCWENSWDPYHQTFTHRTGNIHPALAELDIACEEKPWGLQRIVEGQEGVLQREAVIMPNVLRVTVPSPNALQGFGPRLRDSYLIKVPVDDENHLMYATQQIKIGADQVESYLHAYERYLEHKAKAPLDQIALDILAGRLSLADVRDHPYLAILEDLVAQVGQARIVDRNAEHLGRTDKAIVFMRRVWERELAAIAEGRPTKRWEQLTEWSSKLPVPA